MVYVEAQNSFFYVKDDKVFRLDLNEFTNTEMKLRSSKCKNSMKIIQISKIRCDTIIIYCKDYSMKFNFMGTNLNMKNTHKMGFLCPYCLQHFGQKVNSDVINAHIDKHCGPVSCPSCKVDLIKRTAYIYL